MPAWFYRCSADYVDPNDLLHKSFWVTMTSQQKLPDFFVVNALTQVAYSRIKEFKLSPPSPGATKESLELELTLCEGEAET